ncbi:hypothetical protein CR513_35581, partial [Mucuna pruriens]
MVATFEKFRLLHMPRDQNERADLLLKLASTQKRGQQRSVIHENLRKPKIEKQEVCCVEEKGTWMSLLLGYLGEDWLPNDATKAKMLVREVSKYTFVGQQLYRRGFSFSLLRCVDEEESKYIIQEVHEGACKMHIGGRAQAPSQLRGGGASCHYLSRKDQAFLLEEDNLPICFPTEIVSDNGTQFAS